MMFAGLTSRCTTLCLCAKSRASATCAAIDAADELHRQVAHAGHLAHVVDRDDVGVAQLGRDARLAVEALHQVLEAGARGGQALEADRLDGEHPAEDLVLGLVHGPEGAGAQLLDDLVAPGDLGRFGGCGWCHVF
jgi:hypothetical protein